MGAGAAKSGGDDIVIAGVGVIAGREML